MAIEISGRYLIKSNSHPYYFRYNSKFGTVEIGSEPMHPESSDTHQIFDNDYVFKIIFIASEKLNQVNWPWEAGQAIGPAEINGQQLLSASRGTGEYLNITEEDGYYTIQTTDSERYNWVVRINGLDSDEATINVVDTEKDPNDEGQKWVFTEVPPDATSLIVTSEQTQG